MEEGCGEKHLHQLPIKTQRKRALGSWTRVEEGGAQLTFPDSPPSGPAKGFPGAKGSMSPKNSAVQGGS